MPYARKSRTGCASPCRRAPGASSRSPPLSSSAVRSPAPASPRRSGSLDSSVRGSPAGPNCSSLRPRRPDLFPLDVLRFSTDRRPCLCVRPSASLPCSSASPVSRPEGPAGEARRVRAQGPVLDRHRRHRAWPVRIRRFPPVRRNFSRTPQVRVWAAYSAPEGNGESAEQAGGEEPAATQRLWVGNVQHMTCVVRCAWSPA